MPFLDFVSGIYTKNSSQDVRTSYPKNYYLVPKDNGASKYYARPGKGLDEFCETPGLDRGGFFWNGVLYRVLGNYFCSVSRYGVVQQIGNVAGSGICSFDVSFDRMCVISGTNAYYFNGTAFTKITDPDLGAVMDVCWIDGYFIFTDGQFLIQTELSDPSSINPLKYGSSEVDPDPIVRVLKIRNELVAVNRYTIEYFDNTGGPLFAFSRIDGAQVQKGSISKTCTCRFMDSVAFVGSARNETLGIYLAQNSDATQISTLEINDILSEYSEEVLSGCLLEARQDRTHKFLYFHLPDKSLLFDYAASEALGAPIWTIFSSGLTEDKKYRAQNFVFAYDKWIFSDPTANRLGVFNDFSANHFGDIVRWEFSMQLLYNNGSGAIINQLEIVCFPGKVAVGENGFCYTSYSYDGMAWSAPQETAMNRIGDTTTRIGFFRCGFFRNYRMQKFFGSSDSQPSVIGVNAQLEALA